MSRETGWLPLGEVPGTAREAGLAPLRVAQVAVALPVPQILSYAVPPELEASLVQGQQVRVRVGPRKVFGFVTSVGGTAGGRGDLRPVEGIVAQEPLFTDRTLALGLWVATWYGAAPGEALQAVVPSAVRLGRNRREEVVVHLSNADRAREAIELHAGKAAWEARTRILRILLREGETWPRRDLVRAAGTGLSPIGTLERDGLLSTRRVCLADPFARLEPAPATAPEPTPDQARALAGLLPLLDRREAASALLEGVTGSGKTEVYLRLLERTLELGRGAVMLVPEIALTPQTVERLLGRLPEVAVLHSNLSEGDRAHQWRRLRSGEVKVAVGPRSAIFAPIPDVGLIILDEEHETTFKQQQVPRYHARDVARRRAELEGALLVLGSATPSLEVIASCARGETARFVLPRRVAGRPMPTCRIVDMRNEKPVGPGGMFSRLLLNALEKTLSRSEQALLFLNRRGFATHVLCTRCGWKATCPNCAISLTHYLRSSRLLCHYCGHEREPLRACPDCRTPGVTLQGVGTERVAAATSAFFPGARVARMDGETLRRRGAADAIFQDLKEGRIDVLVGTQVVAKGFDIPGISLVGVISADTALLVPDFRSAERTFQLLCQVAGRTGRGDVPGHVIIQTWSPGHEAIEAAATHDLARFATAELEHRRRAGYPPFGHLLRLVVESPEPRHAVEAAGEISRELAALDAVSSGAVTLMGPAPCPIEVIKGQHRQHMILRAGDAESLTRLLPHLPRRSGTRLRVLIDRDPVALM